MKLETSIPPETLQAYEETEYRVAGDVPVVLQVGVPSAELAAWHKVKRVGSSAFITACNPLGTLLAQDANAARQQDLARELTARSLAFLEGVGQHPTNSWPGEASFLVFGLTLEAAKTLGRRLEQNAVVWAGADAVPQLVLLR